MQKVINILNAVISSRRIIATFLSGIILLLGVFGIALNGDANQITDVVVSIAMSVFGCISGGLALWSYLKPKQK